MSIPNISIEQIQAAAGKLGLRLEDDDRVAVLRELGSTDVWACPGSGKTTLLVAKLYLLATQWKLPHRGICALSHTNVAKEEITSHLAGTARNLLHAPHFVDTIQRFVHEFLAIPALAQKFCVRPQHVMSSEQLGSEIKSILRKPQYIAARNWLERQGNPDSILANVRFSGAQLGVEVPRLRDPDGITYRSLKEIKLSLAGLGMFTYRDMYSLAAWYLATYPTVAEILAYRFPIVFFDETQDTDSEQWSVLSTIFVGRSVVQRFGDHNQAIFESLQAESAGCDFPSAGHLTLSRSMRFSRSIASLVENLSLTGGVELSGDQSRPDRDHAIIQFDPLSANMVLARYAAHVIEQFPDRPEQIRAHAVGAIGRSTGAEAFPACLQHYWPEYDHQSNFAIQRPSCFGDYILLAQWESTTTGSVQRGLKLLSLAAAEVLRLENFRFADNDRLRPDLLLDTLRLMNPELYKAFSAACVDVLSRHRAKDDRDVKEELRVIGPVIVEIMGKRPNASKPFFTQPPAGLDELTGRRTQTSRNRFRYERDGKAVEIQVGTIHSVKGQSHDATMVLETRFRTFDILRCKGFLLGNRPHSLGLGDSRHLRRLYVGATRPRELLVLAMQRSHLTNDDRDQLSERGWTILDVEEAR